MAAAIIKNFFNLVMALDFLCARESVNRRNGVTQSYKPLATARLFLMLSANQLSKSIILPNYAVHPSLFDTKMSESLKNKSRAGRPINANPEVQREKILRAALAEFSVKGFSGASVRTIAQEASIAHGLIRHYFQSKDELFRCAADFLFGQVLSVLQQAATAEFSADPIKRLQNQIRSFVHMSAKLPYMAPFLVQAGLNGGESFIYVVEKYVKPLQELSLAPFREAVAQGLLVDLEPDFIFLIATHAASAPFANSAVRHAVVGDYSTDPVKIDRYADTLINVLMHGCLKKTPG